MVTGQRIVTVLIGLLRGSDLARAIGGGIYRQGTRPRDSKAADLVVIFTTGDAKQFQEGVVTLNIYVPDLPIAENGVNVVDSARCETLEALSLEFVQGLKAYCSDYLFKLSDTIHTQRDEEIGQSFVVVRIRFRHIV